MASTSEGPDADGIGYNLTSLYQVLRKHKMDKIWTFEMFQGLGTLCKASRDLKPGDIYKSHDMFGKMVQLQIPELKDKHIFWIILISYHELSENLDENGNFIKQDGESRAMYKLEVRPRLQHSDGKECIMREGRKTPWNFWQRRWDQGQPLLGDETFDLNKSALKDTREPVYDFHKPNANDLQRTKIRAAQWEGMRAELIAIVGKYKSILNDASQVICFGLGCLNVQNPRSFAQYLIADTIRKELENTGVDDPTTLESSEKRGKAVADGDMEQRSKEIRVLAQDPALCDEGCVEILKRLRIEIFPGCDGFLELDKNTVVIAISPSAPIRQMVVERTLADGGPLAMLCTEIEDEYEKLKATDADGPSENLYNYKQDCFEEKYGDADELLGMTWKEWMESTERNLQPKDVQELPIAEQQQIFYLRSQAAMSIVGDLRFYVRKKM